MVTEDYVSFETAKLLKDKGFPQELGEEGCINTIPYYTQSGGLVTCDINTIRQRYCPEAAAPTLQIAMKWLRKNYDLYVVTRKDFFNKTFTARIYDGRRENVFDKENYIALVGYETYEKASEAAIKYCLENLI